MVSGRNQHEGDLKEWGGGTLHRTFYMDGEESRRHTNTNNTTKGEGGVELIQNEGVDLQDRK